ncbi:MAG: hypothetical protein K8S87_02580 [Planctomycetes bacterium]|nr:hypothetical protein [Planctomycetota bacterium]
MRYLFFASFIFLIANLGVSCRPIPSDTDLYSSDPEPVKNTSSVEIECFADILKLALQ